MEENVDAARSWEATQPKSDLLLRLNMSEQVSVGNRHLIAGRGNAIIVLDRNIDHFFDLADGTTRERFVLPHANAAPDAEKGVSVEIMDLTRLKAIGLDDMFDGQTPQV